MAPKNRGTTAPAAAPPSAAAPSQSVPSAAGTPVKTSTASSKVNSGETVSDIVQGVWNNYLKKTPQRIKLLDIFLGFLVTVGALQFVYCVLAGNYPFNAFLSGFSATVGQFVLTVSLRTQTSTEDKTKPITDERAFADYVFSSLILHFFCVNFIN